jgi:hypothetical protein
MSAPVLLMETHRPVATLEPVRFGEFLRDRHLISDEQWLAALAQHWSEPLVGRKKRLIGTTIVENGYLPAEVVEAEARAFHDDLEVVEVGADADAEDLLPRSERTTLPIVPVTMSVRPEA